MVTINPTKNQKVAQRKKQPIPTIRTTNQNRKRPAGIRGPKMKKKTQKKTLTQITKKINPILLMPRVRKQKRKRGQSERKTSLIHPTRRTKNPKRSPESPIRSPTRTRIRLGRVNKKLGLKGVTKPKKLLERRTLQGN